MKRSLTGIAPLHEECASNARAQATNAAKSLPDISLTLVPPSPITDQINLDIRGAVWNNTDAVQRYEVEVRIDGGKEEERLFQKIVEVGPRSAAGVKFRWPTKGQAGGRKVILTAKSGGKTWRVEKPLLIMASTVRSTGRLAGAWAGLCHWSEDEGRQWNSDIKKMSDDQWREVVRGMHSIGLDVINLQELFRNQIYDARLIEKDGYNGLAFYPSKLYSGRMPIAAKDPVEAILSEADKLGMSVFVLSISQPDDRARRLHQTWWRGGCETVYGL